MPSKGYLRAIRDICTENNILMILDEVQTGVFRTGKFIISHHFGIEPDMVILSKALSGGMLPVGAVLMSKTINESVFDGVDKAFFNQTTFSENALSMRAALATPAAPAQSRSRTDESMLRSTPGTAGSAAASSSSSRSFSNHLR